jgi:hypothetical protein
LDWYNARRFSPFSPYLAFLNIYTCTAYEYEPYTVD